MGRLNCLFSNLLGQHEHVRDAVAVGAGAAFCSPPTFGGRGHEAIPRGPTPPASTDAVGAWLATAAHAEAASVVAFKAVARELECHDAPSLLPRRARAAAQDEVRHAALMESMAMRWGVVPKRPKVASIAVRSLEAMAAENAAEGCVRETWAALEASYQSRWARDPVIRRAMREIAADELKHAEFSWAVDRWARRRLDAAGRRAVDTARRKAVKELRSSLSAERDRNLHVEAGMPRPETARALTAELDRALWG